MNKKAEFWSAHVEAVKREAVSTSAYAKQHGLSVKSLYRWQRVLHSRVGMTKPVSTSASFVAVRVATPACCCHQSAYSFCGNVQVVYFKQLLRRQRWAEVWIPVPDQRQSLMGKPGQ